MKLDPKQVRLITPFWPVLFGRTLLFTGRRNTIHLQETALVAEGEVLLFHCLGLERLFGRAMSSWSTVTVPYSRIVSIRHRSKLLVRLIILTLLFALPALTMQLPRMNPSDWNWFDAAADLIILAPVVLLACLVWWGIPAAHTLRFRSKDGKLRRFHFAVRSRAARRQFDEAMTQYRQAARTHAVGGSEP
jgi:hypothetical protein